VVERDMGDDLNTEEYIARTLGRLGVWKGV